MVYFSVCGYSDKRDWAERQSYEARRLLARALFEEHGVSLMPEIAKTPEGKPYLPDYPDIHISLSHCLGGVAAAVSAHPVGVDVESIREIDTRIAKKFCSERELELIQSSDDSLKAFFTLWTLKESYGKLRGHGFADMKDVELTLSCEQRVGGCDFTVMYDGDFVISACFAGGAAL